MLTLLHTSPVHVASFNRLRDQIAPGAALSHIVREDLLDRARTTGVTNDIASETRALIHAAGGTVLCTCTTLGEVAEEAGALRIDRPVMRAAATAGGPVIMAYCLQSTAAPSRALLGEEMTRAGNTAAIHPLFIAAAWPHFEAGALAAFNDAIATTVRTHPVSATAASIVLAQASMAEAAYLLEGLPVLASPALALRAALGIPQT